MRTQQCMHGAHVSPLKHYHAVSTRQELCNFMDQHARPTVSMLMQSNNEQQLDSKCLWVGFFVPKALT